MRLLFHANGASEMRFEFAYLILSYSKTAQLYRLVKAIRRSSPNSAIVLHHDPSGEQLDFSLFREVSNVFFVEHPLSVRWADFTQVKAVLHSLEWAADNIDFSWISVISGQDYPIRSLSIVEQELRETAFDAFVEASSISSLSWAMAARYYYQYWELPRFRYYYKLPTTLRGFLRWARWALNRCRGPIHIEGGLRNTPLQLGIRTRRHPFNAKFQCYKGSDWFTLSRKAVDYILDFTRNNPSYIAHFRRTYLASEAYVPTILWNSSNLKISNDNRRYILWSSGETAHPTLLKSNHFNAIVTSGKDFGRKFDASLDSDILDKLDQIAGTAGSQSVTNGISPHT